MNAPRGRITSPSNPHVKYARRLQRRRVRDKEGRCLLEGVRLVADAAAAGASFVLGFWEESVLGVPGGEELVRELQARCPVGGFFEVHTQVMRELSDTETPQGIVVVAERPRPDPRELLDREGAVTLVVLDNVRDPGNVGTVVRSADAAGAAGVLVLPGTADPYGPKALRASMGSAFHLPVIPAEQAVLAYRSDLACRSELAALLPDLLRGKGFGLFVADATGELGLWEAPLGGRVAIVLGNEATGADPDLWRGARRVAIPMYGLAESLNVATAATVLLYEAARQRQVSPRLRPRGGPRGTARGEGEGAPRLR